MTADTENRLAPERFRCLDLDMQDLVRFDRNVIADWLIKAEAEVHRLKAMPVGRTDEALKILGEPRAMELGINPLGVQRLVTALSQPAVAGAVDEPDILSHQDPILHAIDMAIQSTSGTDDESYWQHERHAVERDLNLLRTASPSQPAAEDGTLGSCPFCGKTLNIRRSVNPHAECRTEGCFGRKMSSVNLDDTLDVTAWNTRASLADDGETVKKADAILEAYNDYIHARNLGNVIDAVASLPHNVSLAIKQYADLRFRQQDKQS